MSEALSPRAHERGVALTEDPSCQRCDRLVAEVVEPPPPKFLPLALRSLRVSTVAAKPSALGVAEGEHARRSAPGAVDDDIFELRLALSDDRSGLSKRVAAFSPR
jgi:hypothetical protein